jgi:hypothetical protein
VSDENPSNTPPSPKEEELERLQAMPGFQRIMEVIRHLDQYEDFSREFLDKFPDSLPRRFALKIGEQEVGKALVSWKLIIKHLIGVMIMMGKPADMSEDEYLDEVDERLKSLNADEAREAIQPAIATVMHMLEFLPQKLNDAVVHLALEGRQKMIINYQRKIGAAIPSPTKFADDVVKMERRAIKDRLPKLQPSKTKPAWQNTENLRAFAERVEARTLLCQCMKNMYERCDFDEGWTQDLFEDHQFRMLSANIPDAIITWAVRRIADDHLPTAEREPQLIACEVARQELDLPFQEVFTLRGYYRDGQNLLRASRASKKKFLSDKALTSELSSGEVNSSDSDSSSSWSDNPDPQS